MPVRSVGMLISTNILNGSVDNFGNDVDIEAKNDRNEAER